MDKNEFKKLMFELWKKFRVWWAGLQPRTRWIIIGVVAVVLLIGVFTGDEGESTAQKTSQVQQAAGGNVASEKDIERAKKQLDNLYKEQEEALEDLRAYYEDYPLFTVMGSIEDRSEDSLQLWGKTLQVKLPGMKEHWAQRMQDANLVVLEPDDNSGLPHYQGRHYFLKKTSGKNRMGAEVPVLVFGPVKKSVQAKIDKAQKRYDDIDSQIGTIQRQISRSVQVEIVLDDLDFEKAVETVAERVYSTVAPDLTITSVSVTILVSASELNKNQKGSTIQYTKDQLVGSFSVDDREETGGIKSIRAAKSLKKFLKDETNRAFYSALISRMRVTSYLKNVPKQESNPYQYD